MITYPPHSRAVACLFILASVALLFPALANAIQPESLQLEVAEKERLLEKQWKARDLDRAARSARLIADTLTNAYGAEHWSAVDAMNRSKIIETLHGLPEAKRNTMMEILDALPLLATRGSEDDVTAVASLLSETFGPNVPELGRLRQLRGVTLSRLGQHEAAVRSIDQAISIYSANLGKNHPILAKALTDRGDIRLALQQITFAQGDYMDALEILNRSSEANSLLAVRPHVGLGVLLQTTNKRMQANDHFQKAFDVRARLLGSAAPETLKSFGELRTNVSSLLRELDASGKDPELIPIIEHFLESAEITKSLTPDEHEFWLDRLAVCHEHLRQHKQSIVLYKRILNTRAVRLGPNEPDTVAIRVRLAIATAFVKHDEGLYSQAEPILLQALNEATNNLKSRPQIIAECHNSLANHYLESGQLMPAAEEIRISLELSGKALKPDDPYIAKLLGTQALIHARLGQFAEALSEYDQSWRIYVTAYGKGHWNSLNAASGVATVYMAMGQYKEAGPILLETLTLAKTNGLDGLTNASLFLLTAHLCFHQGQFTVAEGAAVKSRDLFAKAYGDLHSMTARCNELLAYIRFALSDYSAAMESARTACKAYEVLRGNSNFQGLDRAYFSQMYSPYWLLAALLARDGKPELAWEALEHHFARGLLDDLAVRAARVQHMDPKEIERETELLKASSDAGYQLANAPAGRKDMLEQVLNQTRLELADHFSRMKKKYGLIAGMCMTLTEIQQRLPENAAIIYWLDLGVRDAQDDKQQYVSEHRVCVVRKHGPPIWKDLTAGRLWRIEDDRLLEQLVPTLRTRPEPGDPEHLAARGEKLLKAFRERRIRSIEEHLDGIRHLIVIPNGTMSRIPLDAAIDKYTVSYAPSASVYGWLQDRDWRPTPSEYRILAVGAPVNSQPVRSVPSEYLEGAAYSLGEINRLFREAHMQVQAFIGADATGRRIEQLARANQLRQFSHIHFGTHGIANGSRGLSSYLELLPARDEKSAGSLQYDGRLTASEILSNWRLHAHVVTLAACETGLGEQLDGEGFVGFSHALFLAGAQNLVVSLWKVDDRATALLMARFYRNLVGDHGARALSPLEALSEAKQWLRKLTSREIDGELRRMRSSTLGTPERVAPPIAIQDGHPFEWPYYWSGFILVGTGR